MADLVPSPDEVEARPPFRLIVLGSVLVILFSLLILRLFSLQVVNASVSKANATANQIRIVTVQPPRGQIVDRSDTVLVGNQVNQDIVLSRLEASQHP